jgi:hypothetical protein
MREASANAGQERSRMFLQSASLGPGSQLQETPGEFQENAPPGPNGPGPNEAKLQASSPSLLASRAVVRSRAISLHAKHAEHRKCPWHLAPRRQDAKREADQYGIKELRKLSEQNSEAAENWNECLAPACLCRTRQTGSPAGGRVTAAGSAPVMAGTFRGSTVILGRAQSSSGQECPGYSTGFACPGWAGYVRRRPPGVRHGQPRFLGIKEPSLLSALLFRVFRSYLSPFAPAAE